MGETEVAWAKQWSGRALAALGLAVCAIGAILLIRGLYPVDLPLAKDPDFIDNVFDNRGVVWAARLLLVSAAAILAELAGQVDESDELIEGLHEMLARERNGYDG